MARRKTLKGLELLRTIAIIAVIIYHINPRLLPGGFIGVTLFFVLSGYLMITSLKKEYDSNGSFDFVKFAWKRIKKLSPSLYIMIACVLVFLVLFNKPLLETSHKDALAGLTYTSNWWYIFRNVGYFDSFAISPFKHLWYLGVLMQMYLITALLFKLFYKTDSKGREKHTFLYVVSFLLVLSVLLQFIIFNPEDVSRAYYGTDTRAFEFLLGLVFGLIYPVKNLMSYKGKISLGILNIDVVAMLSFITFVILSFIISDYSYWLYPFGFLMLSILSAIMIASIGNIGNIVSRIFSIDPILYIGRISYDLYIWHFPILVLTMTSKEIGSPSVLFTIIRVIAFTLISIFVSSFVDKVLFNVRVNKNLRRNKKRNSSNVFRYAFIAFSLLFIMGIFGIAMPFTSTAFVDKDDFKLDESFVANDSPSESKQVGKPKVKLENSSKSDPKSERDSKTEKSNDKTEIISKGQSKSEKSDKAKRADNLRYKKIVLVGDSLSVNVGPAVKKEFENSVIDGKVSRQLYKSADLAKKYSIHDSETTAVIYMLGSNGPFREEHIDAIVKPFKKSDIFFINVKIPDNFEKQVNDILNSYAKKHKNVKVIDWYSVAIKNPEYLAKDKTHLMSSGIEAMLDLIFASLK